MKPAQPYSPTLSFNMTYVHLCTNWSNYFKSTLKTD